MSLVAKIFFTLLLCFSSISYSNQLNILVIGDDKSANCNQHVYESVDGVFQLDLDGKEVAAKDPFLWADCKDGSVWIPLGRELIKSGLADKVVFMPIGISKVKASDWRAVGPAKIKLELALKIIKERNLQFDYLLWQQGSSDIGSKPTIYKKEANEIFKYLKKSIRLKSIIIAKDSSCNGKTDSDIFNSQNILGEDFLNRRFPGPNINLLTASNLNNDCLLNFSGQEFVADQWLESMKNAKVIDQMIQKETLLYYFK